MITEIWSVGPNEENDFNPARLKLARVRRGLTIQRLAELCDVSRRTINSWENGQVELPPVDKMSTALKFPPSFFFSDDPISVESGSIKFRARSTLSAKQIGRVTAATSLAAELSSWVDAHYSTPSTDLPDFSLFDHSPSAAAEALREIWGIHEEPIKNILALLESKGIRVFSLPWKDREVDACSVWIEKRPFIFLNTDKSAERIRFDLAHELGHILLHATEQDDVSLQEKEADEFASNLLISPSALRAQIVDTLRLEDVFKLKKYWRVSAAAMVYQLHRLNLIREWSYRSWMTELSRLGFRKREPNGLRMEKSRIWDQLLRLAREDGWTSRKIANALNLNETDFDGMVFGLSLSKVDGGGVRTPAVSGHLRRIK